MADWFYRDIITKVQGQAPNTAPIGGDPFNPPTTSNFPKLCKDFASLEGRTFSSTEDFADTRARLEDMERRSRLLDLEDR